MTVNGDLDAFEVGNFVVLGSAVAALLLFNSKPAHLFSQESPALAQ